MDNAPGHFEAFERGNIKIMFNSISWKQPMDLGVIAALKKRYKYIYLKDTIEFHELDPNEKRALMEQGKIQRRGSAGVLLGSSAHILDAARYIKNAWENISPITIKMPSSKQTYTLL